MSVKIAIDATNIKAGGGLTHLKQIVENNLCLDVELTIVGGKWLENINNSTFLKKAIYEKHFSNILRQELFKRNRLPKILKKFEISLIPGGTFSSSKVSYVSMSQNMLVFEDIERNRFPLSINWLRYIILEKLQVKSFENAKGVIYISEYAKNFIENKYPQLRKKKSTIIYHGISEEFRQKPKLQLNISSYSREKPFKLTYISIINFYKHQCNVIEAIKQLNNEGFYIDLILIGPIYHPIKGVFEKHLKGNEQFIKYKGSVPYNQISEFYKESDMFIFASTCENMPNILVEAMSAGLPILSSNFGPMPEILKDGGKYFNPIIVDSIYQNVKEMLIDEKLRSDFAAKSYEYSKNFSWEKASRATIEFLKKIALENK